MGRRGVPVTDDAKWVFNRLADAYAARPGYPERLIDRLAELAQGGRVVELGAGTGLLSAPLARRGLEVTAVEPARAMLAKLEAVEARVQARHAAAEETGLPEGTFALVLLADALHWVDPERTGAEARRLLEPGGAVAVVEVVAGGTSFTDALLERMRAANPKARPVSNGALGQFFSLALGRRPLRAEHFEQDTPLEVDRLADFLASHSYLGPAVGPDALAALVTAARQLGEAHPPIWRRRLVLTSARSRGKEAR